MSEVIAFLEQYPALLLCFIIFARIIDVSLGTVRTICVVRGLRITAAVLGFFEVLVWIIAISGVLVDITFLKAIAFATGFAAGNATGIFIEKKIGMGMQMIMFMSRNRAHSVAMALRINDFRVTQVPARGRDGKIAMCFVIVSRRRVAKAMRIAHESDHEVRSVVMDVRESWMDQAIGGYERSRWRAIMKKK